MDFKEKEMNLELKEQDSEHNKKKKEEGSPKRKKGCFKRVLSVLVLVVIIGFSFLAGRQSVMTSNAYGTGLNNGKILRKLSMLEAFAGNYYLNKIDAENVENNIYKGFAKGLQDPYAEYYTPSEYQQRIAGTFPVIIRSALRNGLIVASIKHQCYSPDSLCYSSVKVVFSKPRNHFILLNAKA